MTGTIKLPWTWRRVRAAALAAGLDVRKDANGCTVISRGKRGPAVVRWPDRTIMRADVELALCTAMRPCDVARLFGL